MTLERVIRGHALFQALSVDQVNAIAKFSSVKRLKAGDVVFRHNDLAGHVYMLLAGAVDLRLPASPQEISLGVSKIERGELFGLSPLLDSPRFTATAQCSEDSEILAIEAKPFRNVLKENCMIGFEVMNRVAHICFTRYIDVLKSLQGIVGQISLIR